MEYLYEMHAHVKEVSTCSNTEARKMVECYENRGYSGIVLTDHMNPSTFRVPKIEHISWDEKIDHFLTGYNIVKEAAEGKFNVLLGMEINFHNHPNDYLVYGVTEAFLRNNHNLLDLTPRKFAKIAHENGLIMIQAHPFRRGMQVEDWKILDGYEIFNGNPRHHSSNEMAEIWAKAKNKTIVTSGSDFHEPEDAALGGIYFNCPINTNDDLLRELRSGNYRIKASDIPYTDPE